MADFIISLYRTDYGAITLMGYRPWPRHPFGKRQRAAIKAIAQRLWEEGYDLSELVLERET